MAQYYWLVLIQYWHNSYYDIHFNYIAQHKSLMSKRQVQYLHELELVNLFGYCLRLIGVPFVSAHFKFKKARFQTILSPLTTRSILIIIEPVFGPTRPIKHLYTCP